jgi:hypothetical protein
MNIQENSNALRPRLTVGILTLNEEKRIASCIKSAKFADQILVIDPLNDYALGVRPLVEDRAIVQQQRRCRGVVLAEERLRAIARP